MKPTFSTPSPERVKTFSCPEVNQEDKRLLFEEIQRAQAFELTQGLLARRAEALSDRNNGLLDVLIAIAKDGIGNEEAFAFPIPQYRFIFTEADVDAVTVAARAALHLGALGHDMNWDAQFTHPTVFVANERYKENIVALEQNGAEIIGTDVDGKIHAFEEWEKLPHVGKIGFLTPKPKRAFERILHKKEESASVDGKEYESVLTDALKLIQEFAPDYHSWVTDVLRWIIPITPPDPATGAKTRAFSMYGVPSIVHMSFPNNPLKVADLLIHECSHQYFHVAEDWFRLANGQDTNLYYSHYVKKERPIDRILIAFHAFANVSRFYIECLRNDAPFADKAKRELGGHEQWLSEFNEHLKVTSGLTKAGRNLWQPLADLLFR